MEGADLCIEIVKRATSGFVYSEAVARYVKKSSSHSRDLEKKVIFFCDGYVAIIFVRCLRHSVTAMITTLSTEIYGLITFC